MNQWLGLEGNTPFCHFYFLLISLKFMVTLFVQCTAHLCPLLVKAPQHGRMNCSHPYSPFSYGSHCDFYCNEGFQLRGTPTMTCNSSGHWGRDLPTCQRECDYLKLTSACLAVLEFKQLI